MGRWAGRRRVAARGERKTFNTSIRFYEPCTNGSVSSRGGAKRLEIDLWFHCPAKTRPRLCKGDSMCEAALCGRKWAGEELFEAKNGVVGLCGGPKQRFLCRNGDGMGWRAAARRRQTRGKGQGNITTLCFSADVWRKGPTSQYGRPYATSWPVAAGIVSRHSDALPHGLAIRGVWAGCSARRRSRVPLSGTTASGWQHHV